jgi:hypothetical protein
MAVSFTPLHACLEASAYTRLRCSLPRAALQLGKKPHAHSDYVGQHGPMVLYGLEREIDVMVRVVHLARPVS